MDNDDGPNFAYAYGDTTSSPSPASWNPALRPDHTGSQTAVSSSKSPDAAIETNVQTELAKEDIQVQEAKEVEVEPAHAVPAASWDSAELETGDSFFDRLDSNHATQGAAQQTGDELGGHGVNGQVDEELVNGLQGLGLKDEHQDEPGHGSNGAVHHSSHSKGHPAESNGPEDSPAENYEHQGETTILEEAVSDNAKAPLVPETDSATDDWGASGEVFDLGGKPQDAVLPASEETPLPTPQGDAVGTSVGDDFIGNTNVGGNSGEDIDWGNTDDVDLFGNGPTGGGDTTAGDGWDLSLDDDFLPDTEEATAEIDLGDDEGFLEDEPLEPAQQPVQPPQPTSSAVNRYAPQTEPVAQSPVNPYALQAPGFADFSQLNQAKAGATPNVAYGAYAQPSPYQQQPPRPAMTSSADSFAAKSKGGYHSPYDLPEDIVSTRKRPVARPSTGPVVPPTHPPPRTSGAYTSPTVATRPPLPPSMSTSSLTPPSSSHSNQGTMTGMPPPPKPAPSQTASSDFFAELPITTKPKPSGRYTPQSAVSQSSAPPHAPPAPHAPPTGPPKERTGSWSSLRNEVLPDTGNIALRQPERLPVFPDQPAVPVRANTLPMPAPASTAVPSRYSPQPPAAPPAPLANSRYSPAPPSAGASARYSPAPPPPQPSAPQPPAHTRYASEPSPGLPKAPAQPYAPRTSSPLVHHTRSRGEEAEAAVHDQPLQRVPSHSASGSGGNYLHAKPLEGVEEGDEQTHGAPPAAGPQAGIRTETPPPPSGPSPAFASPRKTSNYAPQAAPSGLSSPGRLLSHSPESTMKQSPRSYLPAEHPTPAYNPPSFAGQGSVSMAHSPLNVIPHRRQASHNFDYIAPTDNRAGDPLERWKGYPIFTWGLGGTVVTSFPKQIPRYGGGASQPMFKCSPGEVKVQNIKATYPLPEEVSKFPGPLKAKGKKKDVSAWLGTKIASLENQLQTPGVEHTVGVGGVTRLEEKILLWKILQVLVDHDGHLEGNAAAEAAVRKVLSQEGDLSVPDADSSIPTAADLVGGMSKAVPQAEPIDPKALSELRSLLTKGEREKAVWHAVDQRLWAHAMLLSSTLDRDIWKQVIQEFVRKEVKNVGGNNQALAVLYEIFAGNWEDCIDELVPASARAGFQMVSTDGAGPTQNALQGLDKWRETLSLILSNRSNGDAQALLSLGRMLAGYGRVEAAHICFIFGRPLAYLGGVDDAQSDIVLLGADHRADPLSLGNEIEPILLTEVYEFALGLSAQGGSHIIPHLQNYKLAHAYTLAEYGYKTEAQAYCDAIATAMKSTTKVSPYYNGAFLSSLDDLSKRLSQSPKDGSSWISKPSMDKVSSSLLSKFNSFIAGDDDDAASTNSNGADVGPFARIAGNTPTISPSQSHADLYGAYSGFGAPSAPQPIPTNSRYAPRSSMDKNGTPHEPQGRPSIESQGSNPYMPSPSFSGPYTPSQAQFSPPSSKAQTYAPLKSPMATSSFGDSYQPTPPPAVERSSSFGGYQPPQASSAANSYAPPSSGGYEPPTSSYEPPTSSYEPPSYQPYNPEEDNKAEEEEPKKKKSFMDDDDDDLAARAAALKTKQKSEADRKADEAFRKAAEADAQKDKDSGKKGGGWLSGWFKKDPNAGPGPIKAKLGEENSFYYDPDLKKWVNKKVGATETAKAANPPPPKSGPPSRSVSDMGGPPPSSMGPPTSAPSPAMPLAPPTSAMRSSSMPPPMGGPPISRASTPGMASGDEAGKPPVLTRPPLVAGSGPPSRPGTGMSTASSIDDLLGAPSAKKGTIKGKKKGGARYVDIMAQK